MTELPIAVNAPTGATVTPPTDARREDADLIDFSALANTIWRRKWLIGIVVILSTLAGGYFAFRVAVPVFRSTAVVVLDTQLSEFTGLESVVGSLSGETQQVNTEAEILKSRRLMGKVVDQLKLIEDPEFNTKLREPSLLEVTKTAIRSRIPALQKAPVQIEPELEQRIRRDSVITVLLQKVKISNVSQSLVFKITVETTSSVKSTTIADTIADTYIQDQVAVKFEETEKVTEWLVERVAQFQQELEEAEAQVAAFNSETALISVAALQAQEIRLKDIRERIENLQASLQADQSKLALLASAENREEQSAIILDLQLAELLEDVDGNSEKSLQFDERVAQIVSELRINEARERQQLTALQNSEKQLNADLSKQGNDLIELQQLKREAEAVRLLYEYFLGRLKETRAQQGIQQPDSRVLSPAVVPGAPSAPQKSLILALSVLIGLLVGVGLSLLLEMRNVGVRSVRELEKRFGYSVFGQIPLAPIRKRKMVLSYLKEKPTSHLAESFRSLRTSIMMSNPDKPPQVILSTSCLPGEGKTTNSIGLAMHLVGLGKKVLLMEGDIRRKTLELYFPGLDKKKGFVSVMQDTASLDEVLLENQLIDGLSVLGSSQNNQLNAADVLSSERYAELLETLRGRFDFIVIDSAPVLVVPDARIIARHCDCVLFNVRWGKTTEYQVEEALRTFHSAGQHISGLILSQVDVRKVQYYGKYGENSVYAGYDSSYYSN